MLAKGWVEMNSHIQGIKIKKGLTVFSNDPLHLEGYIIFSRYFKDKGKI